ncbi:MAG: multidrug ABC transporter ATPase and permease [Parcubacteria group bacterium Gr01-1014_49]|nr:MAG: multidrug ABC transporter ATPase and permease [Parcubacteria group bacterium Gr01-1014_49]
METETVEKINKENLYTGLKVLWKYISEYKKEIVTLSIMGIFSAFGNGVIPYIAGKFFDAITSSGTVNVLAYAVPLYVVLLLLWAVIQLITYTLDWRINILSEKFSNIIWLDYLSSSFGYLLLLPVSFHKTNKIGEITNKISAAANALETIAGRIVIDLSPQILSIIIAISIAFTLKPVLALVLLCGVLVYIFIFSTKIQHTAIYQKEYWDVLNFVFGESYDVVGNALAIKQATAEEYERNRLSVKMKSAVPLWMRLTNLWGSLTLYQRMTILATQIIIFILSISYIHQGVMTIGELLAFNAYAAMVFGPFTTIARNWQTIQNGIVNIQGTEKILQIPPEAYDAEGSAKLAIKGDIEFKNVFFQYEQGKQVLEDISFSIKGGQVVALVGESGVGKSTLIDLISAYHFPTKGEILIDGHDIRQVNLRSLRSQIACVPQEVVLFNDSIKMNVQYGNFQATEEEVRQAATKAHAFDFIEKFPQKWEQVVGERGVKLSVGQKQRVAIARAILRNPRILILDEPTSALDAGSEKIITKSLDELMKGKTTFIVAHRLSTVRKADIILVFKEGRVIESGTHQELLLIPGGEYRRLYELQIGLHG